MYSAYQKISGALELLTRSFTVNGKRRIPNKFGLPRTVVIIVCIIVIAKYNCFDELLERKKSQCY